MDVHFLDNSFVDLFNVDDFHSLIWNEAYIGYGDFELYTSINDYILEVVTFVRSQREKELDTYIWRKESSSVMIVESIEMTTDVEAGPRMIFTGRSLESILERRIIWNKTNLDGNLQNAFKKLLDENIISPSITDRKIPNFIFKASTDPNVTSLKIDKQFTGDNLYEAFTTMCEPIDLGFNVSLNESNQFVFRLVMGVDRSYDQTKVPYVIFSPKFENLIKSSLLEDTKDFKTITLISGEGEGNDRRTTTVGYGSGLARREVFTDARDIQSETYNDEGEAQKIPDDKYFAQLKQRGTEKLEEWKFIKVFEGKVESNEPFAYGQDFYIGDIVQVETEYGVKSRMRIMKFLFSFEESGYSAYPEFKILQ